MQAEKERLHITLHVYDTDMSVGVRREDEEFYRKGAKLITDTINAYAARYKGKRSGKEILYMALIDIALKYEKLFKSNDTSVYVDVLQKLTTEVEDVLNK